MIKAELVSGDFDDNTMTFEIEGKMILKAGKFIILPENEFKDNSLSFTNWLMGNCELSEDGTIWSFDSEDYTNEKLYEIFLDN